MDFSNLHYFTTIAKYGSLSKAAEALYISQPGLSRYLNRLEQQVGVPLFDRRKGKIQLNNYGRLFLVSVEQAFAELNQGLASVQQLYARDQNILSVSCTIEDYLTDLLTGFSVRYPEVGVQQFPFSEENLEEQLLSGTLDFAISSQPSRHNRLRFQEVSQCPYVLICHRDHALASQKTLRLAQAAQANFICETPRLGRQRLQEITEACGFVPRVTHQVESGHTLLNLLRANVGVALIPLAHYRNICQKNQGAELCALSIEDPIPQAVIGVILPAGGVQSAAATAFLDFLQETAQQEARGF